MAKTDTKKTEAKKPTALTKYDIPSESSMAETRAQAGGGGRLSLKKDHEYILRLVPGANGQKPTIGFKSAFVKIDDKTMFAVNKIGPQNTYLDDLLRLYEKSADPMERARADYNDCKHFSKRMPPSLNGMTIETLGCALSFGIISKTAGKISFCRTIAGNSSLFK
jgi:hypothetical protein